MLKNKFYLFITLVLVFGIYAVAGAHGGYNGNNSMMGNGYNQMHDYNTNNTRPGYNGMMGYRGYGMMGGMMSMMGYGGYGMMGYENNMMGRYGNDINNNLDYSLEAVDMTEEQVIELAEELVRRQFGSDYQVADIFIFNNSPYYISVEAKDSDQGAFELLFDPYNRIISPEYGPNMMWNTQYGMSYMMGWGEPAKENMLDRQQALDSARKLAEENGLKVEDKGHQFPGYYTFHTEENGKTEGMLSVNAYTGQVWYHNWHGELADVVEVDGHLE